MRPNCCDCGGPLVDLRGELLPCWDSVRPRCVGCNNKHVRETQLLPALRAVAHELIARAGRKDRPS